MSAAEGVVVRRSVEGMPPKDAAALIASTPAAEGAPRAGVGARWRARRWFVAGFVRAFSFEVARRHPRQFARGYVARRAQTWAEGEAIAFALGQEAAARVGAEDLMVAARSPAGTRVEEVA